MPDMDPEERRARLRQTKGPGPAYLLPPTVGYKDHDGTRKRNPAYSLGLMLSKHRWGNPQSPGPIYLVPKGMTAKGPDSKVAFSIISRAKGEEYFAVGPGPAAYYPNINVNRRKPPAYSLAWRTRVWDVGNASPGPIYKLPPCLGPRIPDKPAAAEVTLKRKGIPVEKLSQSPGPIYDIGRPDLIKPGAPPVTLKSRWKDLKSQSCGAGPGSYNVDLASRKVYRQGPAFSLGIRHTEFAGLFLTECDKQESGEGFEC